MCIFWVQFILILGPVLIVPLALSGEPPLRSFPVPKIMGSIAAALLAIAHFMTPGRLAGLCSLGWLSYTFYLMTSACFRWRFEGKAYTLEWLLALAAHLFHIFRTPKSEI